MASKLRASSRDKLFQLARAGGWYTVEHDTRFSFESVHWRREGVDIHVSFTRRGSVRQGSVHSHERNLWAPSRNKYDWVAGWLRRERKSIPGWINRG